MIHNSSNNFRNYCKKKYRQKEMNVAVTKKKMLTVVVCVLFVFSEKNTLFTFGKIIFLLWSSGQRSLATGYVPVLLFFEGKILSDIDNLV